MPPDFSHLSPCRCDLLFAVLQTSKIDESEKNGKALFIIAEAYAGSKIGDAFDNHSVYWVVVDYLKYAKALDPYLKETADEKIRTYSRLFPTREEGYYRGITDEGGAYSVGGWVSEVTKVRFRKE